MKRRNFLGACGIGLGAGILKSSSSLAKADSKVESFPKFSAEAVLASEELHAKGLLTSLLPPALKRDQLLALQLQQVALIMENSKKVFHS